MTLAVLVTLALVLAAIGIVLQWRLLAKWQQDSRPGIGTAPLDWALILSPPFIALVLFVLCWIPQVQHAATLVASLFLDVICSSQAPIQFCKFPRPLNEFAVMHVAIYLVFVASSLAFVGWIGFGRYQKPRNYDRAKTPSLLAIGVGAAYWILLLLGGQVFFAFGSPLRFWALPFSLLYVVVGVIAARRICLGIRFRRLTENIR
jgi:hypothetical protein